MGAFTSQGAISITFTTLLQHLQGHAERSIRVGDERDEFRPVSCSSQTVTHSE